MPVTSKWYNDEKTILYIKYDGIWSLNEYYENFEHANQMIRSVNHNVVTIIDFSTSGPIPVKFMTVGSHAERASAKNNVQIIVYGMNRYLEMLGGLFQRIFPNVTRGMKLVGSEEEAVEVAQETLSKGVS